MIIRFENRDFIQMSIRQFYIMVDFSGFEEDSEFKERVEEYIIGSGGTVIEQTSHSFEVYFMANSYREIHQHIVRINMEFYPATAAFIYDLPVVVNKTA